MKSKLMNVIWNVDVYMGDDFMGFELDTLARAKNLFERMMEPREVESMELEVSFVGSVRNCSQKRNMYVFVKRSPDGKAESDIILFTPGHGWEFVESRTSFSSRCAAEYVQSVCGHGTLAEKQIARELAELVVVKLVMVPRGDSNLALAPSGMISYRCSEMNGAVWYLCSRFFSWESLPASLIGGFYSQYLDFVTGRNESFDMSPVYDALGLLGEKSGERLAEPDEAASGEEEHKEQ